MKEIHVSLKSEEIFSIGFFHVTNGMIGCVVVLMLLFGFSFYASLRLKKTGLPSKIQSAIELFYLMLEKIAQEAIGMKASRKYLGLVITLFLFIVLGSWFGLLPGILQIGIEDHGKFVPLFRAPTSDLNATIALALVAFGTIQYSGFSSLGFFGYLSKFFSFRSGPINAMLGILELISEFTRLISFSVRLFGNIFAGELLLVVITYLTKGVPVSSAIILMEFFVAMIQAYVFVNLMSIFIAMAATDPHAH